MKISVFTFLPAIQRVQWYGKTVALNVFGLNYAVAQYIGEYLLRLCFILSCFVNFNDSDTNIFAHNTTLV